MFRPIVRGYALVWKELLEVARQPGLVLTLILGPFLVLVIFGAGYRGLAPPLVTILVIPQNLGLNRDPKFWDARFEPSARVQSVTADPTAARRAVETGAADLAVIVPNDAYAVVSQGHHAQLIVLHNRLDPVERGFIGYFSFVLAAELNKEAIAEIIRTAQVQISSLPGVITGTTKIPPEVLAAPFEGKVENLAPYRPSFVAFYTPGVLALLLQHMAITFAALSLVRERLLGTVELYQVAPISTLGVLAGKYVSYGILGLVVAVVLTALIQRGLGVPILGDLVLYWSTLALLVFASIGVGLTISLLSSSQEQAVQFAMLVLLASVLFSGFILSLNMLQVPATVVSAVLPITHAVSALQSIMLRGRLPSYVPLYALGGIGCVFLVLSSWLLRRQLRQQ